MLKLSRSFVGKGVCWTMIVSLSGISSAVGGEITQAQVQRLRAISYLSQPGLKRIVENNRHLGERVEDQLKVIQNRFGSEKDASFFWNVQRSAPSSANWKMRLIDGGIAIESPGSKTVHLTRFNRLNQTVLLNGKLLNLNDARTLEEAYYRVNRLLGDSSATSAVLNFLVPEAEAAFIYIIFAVIVIFLIAHANTKADGAAAISEAKVFKDMERLRKSCENRDDSIPYGKSEALKLYGQIYQDYEFLMNNAEKAIKASPPMSCREWGNVIKKEYEAGTYEALVEFCDNFVKAEKCITDYEKGILRGKAIGLPHAPAEGGAQTSQ